MSNPSARRWAGAFGVVAAILIILSEAVRLATGLLDGSNAATITHTLTYSLALLGMCSLLLAVTAIYALNPRRLGRLGGIGYLFAFVGTLFVAGDWWFEAFVVPTIATEAPHVLEQSPSGSLVVGAIATIGLYSVGWLLFGLATFRSRTIPRPAAVFLVIGGLIGPLALTAPYQIPLALGIGWIGYKLIRAPGDVSTDQLTVAHPVQTTGLERTGMLRKA
jgi:hypothetical protein